MAEMNGFLHFDFSGEPRWRLGCSHHFGDLATVYDALGSQLHGELLEPGSTAYDTARVVWNGIIDRRPAAIARCRNAADVMACLNAARDNSLLVAVRTGGHNVAGYAVCDSGLIIDLSLMNGVRLDPQLDRAYVEGVATGATSTPQPHRLAARHRVG